MKFERVRFLCVHDWCSQASRGNRGLNKVGMMPSLFEVLSHWPGPSADSWGCLGSSGTLP